MLLLYDIFREIFVSVSKNNHKIVFDSIIILRFGETKIAKEKFYAVKNPLCIWDVNINNIVISKLIKTKTNSKHFTGYLDKIKRHLVFILPKMSGYVKTFKVKDGDKDKNNKLMSFRIDDVKLLEKYALPVFDDRYIADKISIYGDKV